MPEDTTVTPNDPAFNPDRSASGKKISMTENLAPTVGGVSCSELVANGTYQQSYVDEIMRKTQAGQEGFPPLKCTGNDDLAYGGLQSVLIPVEQASLLTTFNIMVAVILVLVLILIYYVMQLQKKQSCRAVKRRSQQVPEDDPLELNIVQDNSLQGFEVNKSVTDYMSYGNVPVHSSNSAVLPVGTYDGQTYIPNSSKNKLLRDALLTKEMGPRSQTDVQGMVEYEHARKMG